MQTTVQLGDHSYPILIQKNAVSDIASVFDVQRKIALITDTGVPKQWVQLVEKQCPDVFVCTIPQGEGSKCFLQYESLLKECIDHHMTRKDAVIALGGGVVGDLAGFVAATYMRGIDFYNIPSTLLSQVDSGVGGKVAIDVDQYKNIVGAFWQPKAVIIDPGLLSSLPVRHIHNGLVEALKSGLIQDAQLVDLFEQDPLDLETIITRSVLVKKHVVEEDEKELTGIRQCLNFGHTIGHAIESAYGLDTYLHGECVAMGMLFFIEDEALKQRVLKIYEKLDLPAVPDYDPDVLLSYLAHDKKANAQGISVVKVKEVGQYTLETMSLAQMKEVLERGAL